VSRQVPAEFFIELEPKMGRRWDAGLRQWEDRVESARAVRTTKNKPDNVGQNNVVVKLKVYVPEHLFVSGVPEAIVILPEDPAETVTVQAQYEED